MELSIVPVWITSVVAVILGVYTMWRNGKSASKENDKFKNDLKSDLDTIRTRLDDKDNGLSSIKKAVDDQRIHCVKTSTSLSEQVKAHSNEIIRLRSKKEHKE